MAHPVHPEAGDLKIRFMQSPHIVWSKFCEAEGLPYSWRDHYPTAAWVDEKKKIIAQKQGEALGAALFDRRFKWHNDVIHTLNEYPKLCDQVTNLLIDQINHIKKTDIEKRDVNQIVSLSYAAKGVTEAKYKSLLIDKWNVKEAEDDSKPDERQVDELSKGFHMVIKGMGEVSAKDVENIMAEFLDKPPVSKDGD